jgi:ribose 5-phosphate isomerase A
MTAQLSPIDTAKMVAATRSVALVEDGMKLGLGTGSTAAFMLRALAGRVEAEGLRVTCVATSQRTEDLARNLGLEVVGLDEARWLDLTIDGADEFDRDFNLIKGGGAALLREKIVASASDRMVVITDASKEVATLGAFPLPVEIIPFGAQATRTMVEDLLVAFDVLGHDCVLRREGDRPVLTDNGNHILDLHLTRIADPVLLALRLNQIPGVVENGLFIGICDTVVIGHGDGRVEVRDQASGSVTQDGAPLPPVGNIFGGARR